RLGSLMEFDPRTTRRRFPLPPTPRGLRRRCRRSLTKSFPARRRDMGPTCGSQRTCPALTSPPLLCCRSSPQAKACAHPAPRGGGGVAGLSGGGLILLPLLNPLFQKLPHKREHFFFLQHVSGLKGFEQPIPAEFIHRCVNKPRAIAGGGLQPLEQPASVSLRLQQAFGFVRVLRQRFQRFDDEKVTGVVREHFSLIMCCESQFAHPLGGAVFNSPVLSPVVTLSMLEIGKRFSSKDSDFLSDFVGHHVTLLFVFGLRP